MSDSTTDNGTETPVKAIAYLRVSGIGQIGGDGFDRQREAIRGYAIARRMNVVGEYRDEGVSGTRELCDRPGLAEVIVHIESNGVRCVLVENASRLARDLMVQEIILQQFRALGVKVIDVSTGFDMASIDGGDPTQTLIRQVLGAVMQFEKEMLVLKLRASRERARRRHGKCEGVAGYGEDEDRPSEKDGLAFMLKMDDGKATLADITRIMNGSVYRPRKSKRWSQTMVTRILARHSDRRKPKDASQDADA